MADTRSGRACGGDTDETRTRARAHARGTVATLVAAALLLAAAAGAGTTAPRPTSLSVFPEIEALRVGWGVTSTEGLAGFRVDWRRVAAEPQPWSKPVERSASARVYTITGLAVQPYEVRVRAILTGGALGTAVTGTGTPHAPPPEEPPIEVVPEGTVLPRAPAGVPTPSGGWHVVFGDAFGAPIGTAAGEDKSWRLPEQFQKGFNHNELEVWSPSQVSTSPAGLDLACKRERDAGGTKKNYLCGFVDTSGRFAMRSYGGSTFALECVGRWPLNTGEADPSWWQDGHELGLEQEIDDFEGLGWHSDGSWEYGAVIPIAVGLGDFTVDHDEGVTKAFGFGPTLALHRYTTLIKPVPTGLTEFAEYIDGAFKWRFTVPTPSTSVWQHVILSYALRVYPWNFTSGTRHFYVRSVEVFQDAAHAGSDVQGGGVAPGTTLGP